MTWETDELQALRTRILAGCRSVDNVQLVHMLTNRRNALARMQEHEMPRAIVGYQEVMVDATEEVARERGLI